MANTIEKLTVPPSNEKWMMNRATHPRSAYSRLFIHNDGSKNITMFLRGSKNHINAFTHIYMDYTLINAATKGKIDKVKQLIDDQKCREQYDKALYSAAANGHIEIVKLLINAGANNRDALIRAVTKGHFDIVKALIECGADVHADDDMAITIAAKCGRANIVEFLLTSGTDVHVCDDRPLRDAADLGYADVVDILLRAGANVHAKDDEALSLAAIYGHTDVAALLIKYGANVRAYNDYALRESIENQHTEIVRLLLPQYDVLPNEIDESRFLPIAIELISLGFWYPAFDNYMELIEYHRNINDVISQETGDLSSFTVFGNVYRQQ